MNKKKNIHVVPHKSDRGNPPKADWAVRGERNYRNTAIKSTKKEAIIKAKQIAKNQNSELIIHNRTGKIKIKNSYGRDPYPPKG